MRNFVAYYRVPIGNRDDSLLEAERAAVAARMFGHDRLVAQFTEVETRSHPARAQLKKAIREAKAMHATLAIAKFGKLTCSPAVLRLLIESRLHIEAADIPTLHREDLPELLEAALARSNRVSEGMRAARGAKVSDPTPHGWAMSARSAEQRFAAARGAARSAALADEHAATIMGVINKMGMLGHSLHSLANALNKKGVPTQRGGRWYPMSVRNLLARNVAAPLGRSEMVELSKSSRGGLGTSWRRKQIPTSCL